ncbi:MAG TPA: hypothetical protein VLL27_03780 [Solirubrobacterales bacterium]|nr:hypothetical protein [Solirubrobacterales bacterium]
MPTGTEQPDPEKKKRLKWEDLGVVGTILAAVGGSIGLISFVAFFGAAIIWIRMDAAGLPGNEAVALVPRSVLLSTGANFLVPSLLVALGFTTILYLVESGTIFASTQSLESFEAVAKKRREAIEVRRAKVAEDAKEADEAAERALAAEKSSEKLAATKVVNPKLMEEVEKGNTDAIARAAKLQREAAKALQQVELEMIKFTRSEAKDRQVVIGATNKFWRRHLRWGLFILLFSSAAVAMFFASSIGLYPGRFLALVLLLVALSVVCLSILKWTDSFLWFALATFAAVGVLAGILTYYRTVDNPKVEPAALLRSQGSPVFGFFVAQTSDRVYLGTKPAMGLVRLDVIPREEVISLAVGSLEDPTVAEEHAISFARELCRRARERQPTGEAVRANGGGKWGEEVAEGCTADDLDRLNAESSPD